MKLSHILTLALVALLTGCGATPVFLGDSDDGATFIVRVTKFEGRTGVPGVAGMLSSLVADRGVGVVGCQMSMRGEVPKGARAELRAGEGKECSATVGSEEPSAVEDALSDLPFILY